MDKIQKALKRLSPKERLWVRGILVQLQRGDYKGLDLKKLKGSEGIFRVRKGDIRLLYRLKNGRVFVLAIERRDEKTYR